MYEKYLEGVYDLHVHTAPDISKRKLDDFEYAERMAKFGMKGFGIKSHYFNSAERATLVNKQYPTLNIVGAVTLNKSVGGLNPTAVEMAAKSGAKIVWMPTFDSQNEMDYTFGNSSYETLPPWAQVQLERQKEGKIESTGITVLNEGSLKEEVKEIVNLAKENCLILATGHLSKKEIVAMAHYSKSVQFKKLVITHPTFSSIALTKEEQLELVQLGATLEHCYGVIAPHYGTDWPEIYKTFEYIGSDHLYISSDLGQIDNPYPDEGILDFIKRLLENGFSEEFVRKITVEKPAQLIES